MADLIYSLLKGFNSHHTLTQISNNQGKPATFRRLHYHELPWQKCLDTQDGLLFLLILAAVHDSFLSLHITSPLWGESTGHQTGGFPSQSTSNVELSCSLFQARARYWTNNRVTGSLFPDANIFTYYDRCRDRRSVKQSKLFGIWVTVTLIWRHSHAPFQSVYPSRPSWHLTTLHVLWVALSWCGFSCYCSPMLCVSEELLRRSFTLRYITQTLYNL